MFPGNKISLQEFDEIVFCGDSTFDKSVGNCVVGIPQSPPQSLPVVDRNLKSRQSVSGWFDHTPIPQYDLDRRISESPNEMRENFPFDCPTRCGPRFTFAVLRRVGPGLSHGTIMHVETCDQELLGRAERRWRLPFDQKSDVTKLLSQQG